MTKGSILDMIYIPIILLVLGISVFVAAVVMSEISPDLSAMSPAANNTTARATEAVNTFNWSFLLIAFALGAGSVMLGFIYPSQPIFFFIGFIMLIISMVTTAMISNVFTTFSTSPTIAASTGQFTIINWFMQNALTIFMAVFGSLMLIVLYTKLRGGRE